MNWIKKGLVFVPDRQFDWMVSHAAVPVADDLSKDELRLYFGTRDTLGRSQLARIDVAADAPHSILRVHDRPVLPLGASGTFDDNGIMPASMVNYDGRKYLYYIGWNPQVIVPYRLAIGLAVSEDGGRTFNKASEGPVADRGFDEPYFNTAPSVLVDGGVWRMWYVSCTGWHVINGRPEPRYHVKYADSRDGVRWRKTGDVCIDYDERTEAIGRPCVYRENGAYRMLYSYRSLRDYRTDPARSYRLGYAESPDGFTWTRRDDEVGIERSADGWDSEMIEYATVHQRERESYLFYNGNGFGKSGLGYAVRER